jgi:phage tail tube protein FII
MADLDVHIKRIQQKLQQLLKQYGELQKENIVLKKEVERSTQQTSQHQQTIETLKQQVEVLKISSGNWDENDKKEFEKRINHYIKEIDKCISLLSE